ncbi:GNAT family acetyltransferase [Brevibacillus parabrevis]|uniref:GNAT family N-acetyltransferase n=1 Tax=Brevibacillus parabrevis TaxID=54914 RepID=UPI0007AB6A6C|nr:GNAT family N-acetyltransferase [Brevibacillus parabrevis]KZE53978.1 GNAT family acetyltransferase [Brevibacillus parabrevis]
MREYQLISDYKHNQTYKKSFNELAKQVFQLDFHEWYTRGCWNDDYICYSYVDGEKVIANVSVNKMIVTSNGRTYQALQLGTVMTHPDYRQQGLAAKLTNHVIAKYEKDYDFLYLFANPSVLDFYPKFGFQKVQESRFTLMTSHVKAKTTTAPKAALRKLDVDSADDFARMKEFAASRVPVSTRWGVQGSEHLSLFYFLIVFPDSLYYIEEEDVIVLFEREGDLLHVFDIVSKRTVDSERIIEHLLSDETNVIQFHFMPESDNEHIQAEWITETDDTLFVRPSLQKKPKHFLFPLTSHA